MSIRFDQIKPHNDGLRDYQISAKVDIYNAWIEHQNLMFQMPTGTGKTRLFSSIIKDLHLYGVERKQAVKMLILAHRDELIEQISDSIGIEYGIHHGKIKSRHDENQKIPIQVASVQTLHRRLEKWEHKDFDVVIIDEAHHVLAATYKNICKAFPNAKILGVTATPYRLNAEAFTPMFDKLICSKSINYFIKEKYLSEYKYYSIKPNSQTQQLIKGIEIDKISGDYSERAMTEVLDNIKVRANILKTYQKYADGKKGIIYTIDKAHNKHVCETFREKGYSIDAIDSDTPHDKRKELVKKFKYGEIQILCNVNIFSEGFDCPDVEFIQLARPTISLAMYLQQVGRGFRPHENKEFVIFLDNVGQCHRFGLPSQNIKWQYYFEGRHKGINCEHAEDYALGDAQEIEEGDENVQLIYNSENETEELNDDAIWEMEEIEEENETDIEDDVVDFAEILKTELQHIAEKVAIPKDFSFSFNYNSTENAFQILCDEWEDDNRNDEIETIKEELNAVEQEIEIFKKYNIETPAELTKKHDNLSNEIIVFVISEFKENPIFSDYSFLSDFSITFDYTASENKFEIVYDGQIYAVEENSDEIENEIEDADVQNEVTYNDEDKSNGENVQEKVIRLTKAAKEFNIATQKVVEFLRSKGFKVSSNPNTKLSIEMYQVLEKAFRSNKKTKEVIINAPDEKKRKVEEIFGMLQDKERLIDAYDTFIQTISQNENSAELFNERILNFGNCLTLRRNGYMKFNGNVGYTAYSIAKAFYRASNTPEIEKILSNTPIAKETKKAIDIDKKEENEVVKKTSLIDKLKTKWKVREIKSQEQKQRNFEEGYKNKGRFVETYRGYDIYCIERTKEFFFFDGNNIYYSRTGGTITDEKQRIDRLISMGRLSQ